MNFYLSIYTPNKVEVSEVSSHHPALKVVGAYFIKRDLRLTLIEVSFLGYHKWSLRIA